jgi:hypothetical protein
VVGSGSAHGSFSCDRLSATLQPPPEVSRLNFTLYFSVFSGTVRQLPDIVLSPGAKSLSPDTVSNDWNPLLPATFTSITASHEALTVEDALLVT